jgi:protein phosphatase
MGTTVVCAVVRGWELFVGHVGDSRAYLLRDGGLRQIT